MSFNSFVNIFTNSPIQPADVSYLTIPVTSSGQNTVLEWVFQNPATLTPFTQAILVTGTATGSNSITLPNALYSSIMQSTIIYNTSNEDVIILNNVGVQIGVIAPSLAYFVGNTSNATAGGNWNFFVNLGAGSSSVVASDLIDPTDNGGTPAESNSGGLGAFGSYLKLNTKVYEYSGTNYTGTPSDRGTIVTWEAGSGTYTLPLSTEVVSPTLQIGNGFITGLQNRSSTGGVITVALSGSDLLNPVNGVGTSQQIQVGESTFFVTDGSGNWFTFCYSSNAQYAIQATSTSVATSGGTINVSNLNASYQIQAFTGTYGGDDVTVNFPTSLVQQYFINNLSTNNLIIQIINETNPLYIYTMLPGATLTTFTDGAHLYLSPNSVVNEIIELPDGSLGAPSLGFINDTTTGLYRNTSTSALTIVQSSVAIAAYTSTLATFNVTLNNSTESYQQAGINIYSLMRAYG